MKFLVNYAHFPLMTWCSLVDVNSDQPLIALVWHLNKTILVEPVRIADIITVYYRYFFTNFDAIVMAFDHEAIILGIIVPLGL